MMREGLPGDATTLIYLAKADAFTEAGACVVGILASPTVWRESVEAGERTGAPDARRIPLAVEAGIVRRVELPAEVEALAERIAAEHRLGRGESEVLALAYERKEAIIDEGRAARVATALGIAVVSTLFLPVLGRRRGRLDEVHAIALLRRLAVVTGTRAEVVFAIEEHLRRGMP